MLTLIFAIPEVSTINNPEMSIANRCEKYIAKNERLKLKLYFCSEGIATIGYGRNLISTGINKEEAQLLLKNDIEKAVIALYGIFTIDKVKSWPYDVQIAIIDMIFNIGEHGFKQFKKMIAAIKNRNFELAAKELLDSRYAKQVPNRAKRNADMLRK